MGDVPIRTGRTAPIRLGMVRLTDAAPLVLAQSSGLFAAEDLDVVVSVEPSWANIADKLAWGLLEGAVMLPPLAIAMALGLRGPPTRLIVPAGISLNGNAITLGHRFAAPILSEGFSGPAVMAARLRSLLEGGSGCALRSCMRFRRMICCCGCFWNKAGSILCRRLIFPCCRHRRCRRVWRRG